MRLAAKWPKKAARYDGNAISDDTCRYAIDIDVRFCFGNLADKYVRALERRGRRGRIETISIDEMTGVTGPWRHEGIIGVANRLNLAITYKYNFRHSLIPERAAQMPLWEASG